MFKGLSNFKETFNEENCSIEILNRTKCDDKIIRLWESFDSIFCYLIQAFI